MTERLDLDALEAVARAATPGPWSINWETDEYHAGMPDRWALSINGPEASEFADLDSADAEHIATFDPPTVLALIKELREAEQAFERHKRMEPKRAITKLREAEAVNNDTLGFIHQTVYANEGSRPGLKWTNGEVLELLGEIRGKLTAPADVEGRDQT